MGNPTEYLGPLGLTIFLLAIVLAGGRFIVSFIKDVIADLRKERDEARVDARESDAAAVAQANAIKSLAEGQKELIAEVRQITTDIRDGHITTGTRRVRR